MTKSACFVIVIAILAFLSGCVHFKAVAPNGFAQYKEGKDFRAISPNGIVYRIKKEPNLPKADLSFWKEALKNRMVDAGYSFVSEESIQSHGENGYLLELAAPYGQLDYSYLIGIYVRSDEIYVVESAGEVSLVKKERPSIIDAMKKVSF